MPGNRWAKIELNYLKKNYSKKRIKDIAKHLGRPIGSIYVTANTLGLKKWGVENQEIQWRNMLAKKKGSKKFSVSSYKEYSDEEIDIIKEHWYSISHSDMSEMLGRTVMALKYKARDLGLIRIVKSEFVRNPAYFYREIHKRAEPLAEKIAEKNNILIEFAMVKAIQIVKEEMRQARIESYRPDSEYMARINKPEPLIIINCVLCIEEQSQPGKDLCEDCDSRLHNYYETTKTKVPQKA